MIRGKAKTASGVTDKAVVSTKKVLSNMLNTLTDEEEGVGKFEVDAELERRLVKIAQDVAYAEAYHTIMTKALERELGKFETERAARAAQKRRELADNESGEAARGDDEEDKADRQRQRLSMEDEMGFDASDLSNVMKRVKDATAQAASRVQLDRTPLVQEVANKLHAAEAEEGDEDIKEVRKGAKKEDFHCPFSQVMMTEPMTNGECIHRIDRSSLASMLKGKREAACPLIGCNKMWKMSTAVLDADFQRKLERYKRLNPEGAKDSGDDAVSIDDDEEEDCTEL
jgi:hypothetical protein